MRARWWWSWWRPIQHLVVHERTGWADGAVRLAALCRVRSAEAACDVTPIARKPNGAYGAGAVVKVLAQLAGRGLRLDSALLQAKEVGWTRLALDRLWGILKRVDRA